MAGYCVIDVFSRVCLGLITVVVVTGGICLIVVLVKVKRLVDEAAKTIRQTKEFFKPVQTIAGFVLGLTKGSQFFRGRKEKKEE